MRASRAICRRIARSLLAGLLAMAAGGAAAFDYVGEKRVILHARDGTAIVIGALTFAPEGTASRFALAIDTRVMHDHFLSMKEFKCAEGGTELLCHVPYPYANPSVVRAGDLAWLEHALLFFFKKPGDFGAKLWNGVYFRLAESGPALVGAPQAIDLNLIGAPPDDLSVPPYDAGLRSEIEAGARWFVRLSIE